ncbi:endonuclease/exonuclease/phosphatase family protein [Nitratifractor sp.]
MTFVRIFLCFLFFAISWIHGGVPEQITVASWNVENLFDAIRDGDEYDEYVPGRHGWDAHAFEVKRFHIARVLCDLDADVVALQEIENAHALQELQETLRRVGCPYPYSFITRFPDTPVHVAILSKFRLRQMRDIPIRRTGRYRSILEAVIPGKVPLRIFVNHWKSQSGPESERILYAKALERRLRTLDPGSEYIVLGDFNTDYDAFLHMDPRLDDTHGATGLNQILHTAVEGRLIRPGDLSRFPKGAPVLANLWLELPASRRWSHNFYGNKQAIDAILIPPTLADGENWEYVPGSFGVFRPSYLFGAHGEIRRWGYRHGRHTLEGYSDHLPVFARFRYMVPSTKQSTTPRPKRTSIPEMGIDRLVRSIPLQHPPIRLHEATVVWKRGRHAVLQERPDGPAILVYGAAAGLREGHRYVVDVYKAKRYKTLPEITDLQIVREVGTDDPGRYIHPLTPKIFHDPGSLSWTVGGVTGRYNRKELIIGATRYPIHFKKRRWIPPEGSRIRILRSQIGRYRNRRELVIWDRNDFATQE